MNAWVKMTPLQKVKFLNWKYLKPLQDEFCVDLVKDSSEALRWLGDQDPKGSFSGFSWDFVSLYDNLTPELINEALRIAISELRPDWSSEFVEWILDLVNISISSSFGKHGRFWYRNLKGIATRQY